MRCMAGVHCAKVDFSPLVGRHHCRYCGWAVCLECWREEKALDRWVSSTNHQMKSLEPPEKKMKKVCALCVQHLDAEVMARQSALKPLPNSALSGTGRAVKFSGLSPRVGNIKRLYHATDEKGARSIADNGFMLQGHKECMFGSGIYLAAKPEHAKQKAWAAAPGMPKRNAFIIEADVELGRCWQVPPGGEGRRAQKQAPEMIRDKTVPGSEGEEFNSVWARPLPDGPMQGLDEWVVYDPNQLKIISIRNPTTKEVIPHKQARPQERPTRKKVADSFRVSFVARSGGATAAACVAAEGHKAAGTALFKAGKFLAAEREYSAGIAEIWGVDLASVSSPREYVLDLQFSLALNAGENSRTDPELRSFSSIPSPLLLAFCQLVYAADTRRIVAAAAATSAHDGHGRWTAAAQLKLEDHAAALASSEKALGKVTDPGDLRQVKALYRKGAALLSLGRVAEAKNTLTMAYKLDSTNKQVSNLLKRAMKAEVRRHRWSGR